VRVGGDLGDGLAIAWRRGDFAGLLGEAWTGRMGLRAARVERVGGESTAVGLTILRTGAGEGAAFSLSTCLPLPLFALFTISSVFALLAPSFDFNGDRAVPLIDRGCSGD
jgi:hypothetical protein